ncbi:MAG TPA: SDR family NAD(P)-dependent oxidoreductase [Alphaproteobacteria bacterium]
MADYAGVRVLVTGADGFIGSHLVERLAAGGAKVTALALYNAFDSHGWLDELPAPMRASVRIERGDVRDAALVLRLCRDQEVVFHLAALIAVPYSYGAAQSYIDVNVTGAVNLLEAARAHAPRRVVMTSTSEVYGTARRTPIDEDHPLRGQSPYAASKIAADAIAEAYALSFALPVVVLRPFNTYGPRQSERAVIAAAIRQALDPDCAEIRLGDLSPSRDFTFIADTVAAFAAAGSAEGLAYGVPYNAGTGVALSIEQVVEVIRRLVGTNKPVVEEAVRRRPAGSEVLALLADSTRFSAAAGWRAETGLDQGLALTVEWWRERLARGAVRAASGFIT